MKPAWPYTLYEYRRKAWIIMNNVIGMTGAHDEECQVSSRPGKLKIETLLFSCAIGKALEILA